MLAATRDELAGSSASGRKRLVRRLSLSLLGPCLGSEQTGDKGRGYARAFEGSPISQGNELRWQEMLARRLRPLLEEREARCGMRRGLHATRVHALERCDAHHPSVLDCAHAVSPCTSSPCLHTHRRWVHSRVGAGRPPHHPSSPEVAPRGRSGRPSPPAWRTPPSSARATQRGSGRRWRLALLKEAAAISSLARAVGWRW